MKRLECLDGLRGVLAVYVMLGHMAPFSALPAWITQPLSHGGAAVDVFFILSGMVIVHSLQSFRYQPRPFLIARIARTYPVYLVMLAVTVAVQPLPSGFERMGWIAPDSLALGIWSQGWPHAWLAEIAAHLTMTHGMFPNGVLPDAWVSFLGAAWSLSTEWQFYGLALLLGRAGLRARGMVVVMLALTVAGLAWQVAMPEAWAFSRAFLPNKALYFALGIASAELVGGWRVGSTTELPPSVPQGKALVRYGLVLAATLALCACMGPGKLLPPLVWTLCLAAQLRPGLPGPGIVAAALRGRTLQWFGATSYCIYLANEPIQKLLGLFLARIAGGNGSLFTILWLPAATLLPLAAAAALHRWIEAPAQRAGHILARQWSSPAGEPGRGHRRQPAPAP